MHTGKARCVVHESAANRISKDDFQLGGKEFDCVEANQKQPRFLGIDMSLSQ